MRQTFLFATSTLNLRMRKDKKLIRLDVGLDPEDLEYLNKLNWFLKADKTFLFLKYDPN